MEIEFVRMIDQFASAIEENALDAAAGVIVRGSVSGWSRLIDRFRRDPKILRADPRWADIRLTAARAEIVRNYLASPECQGLLQILMYVQVYDSGRDIAIQSAELERTFCGELVNRLGWDHPDAQILGQKLWRIAANALMLCAQQIKKSDSGFEARLLAGSLLAKQVPSSGQIKKRGGSAAAGKPKTIAAIIPERAAFAEQYDRSLSVLRLVDEIRQSQAELYSKLVMPHAREQYSVDIDAIYVPRRLQYVEASELAKTQASLLLPEITLSAVAKKSTESSIAGTPEGEIDDHRMVIIGNPGAGKTTFVRYAMHSSSRNPARARASFIFELKKYPFGDPRPFYELIADGIRAVNHIEADSAAIRDIFLLGLGNVIFDGLDEVTDLNRRRQVIDSIEGFVHRFPLVRVMVTSREEGYSAARLNSALFSAYRLPDFNDSQIEDYVHRWFSLTADPSSDNASFVSSRFLEESEHAADLRPNPLMLSLLCMLYRYEGYIPENRPQVYEECAELLFDRWDKVRHVRSHIRPDAKGRYLVQEIAYFFFTHQRSQGGAEEYVLQRVLQDYLVRNIIADQEEARTRAREFLDYCAGRAWLLARVGTSPRGDRLFGFTHRTFMEYFAGCYFVRHHPGLDQFVEKVRELIDAGGSEIVPQIAIQRFDENTAGGLDDCLSMLLFGSRTLTERTRTAYIPCVLRCLRFMSPTPYTLDKIFAASFRYYSTSRSPEILLLLTSMNRECQSALARFCERVAEVSSSSIQRDSLSLIIACYMIVIRTDDERFTNLRSSLETALLAHREELSKWGYVDFVSELLAIGAIDPDTFARTCGASSLFAMEISAAGRMILLPGVAALEIKDSFECDIRNSAFNPGPVLKVAF